MGKIEIIKFLIENKCDEKILNNEGMDYKGNFINNDFNEIKKEEKIIS
jgi:hypothetical protein